MMTRQHTTIGYLHRAQIDAKFHDSLIALCMEEHGRRLAGRLSMESSPRIASGRNVLVRRFLHSQVPWLLMLDDDMVFGPDLLERLHVVADEFECPVLSGLYFLGGQQNELRPAMLRFGESPGHVPTTSSPVYDYESGDIVDADAVGVGCLLVHRSVLAALEEKWVGRSAFPFFAEAELNGNELGEDVTFCLRLRALGVRIRVDTGLVVGHSKGWVFTEEDYRRARSDRELKAVG